MAKRYRKSGGGARRRSGGSYSNRRAAPRRQRRSTAGGTIRLVIEQPAAPRMEAPPGMVTREPKRSQF